MVWVINNWNGSIFTRRYDQCIKHYPVMHIAIQNKSNGPDKLNLFTITFSVWSNDERERTTRIDVSWFDGTKYTSTQFRRLELDTSLICSPIEGGGCRLDLKNWKRVLPHKIHDHAVFVDSKYSPSERRTAGSTVCFVQWTTKHEISTYNSKESCSEFDRDGTASTAVPV